METNDFGFWRSFGDLRFRQIVFSWDFGTALLLAVGGSALYVNHVPEADKHAQLAGDFLSVAGALFGVVLGGFAVAAAFLGDKYSRLLRKSGASPLKMLRHFLIAGGFLVAAIVSAVIYRAAALPVWEWKPGVEQIAFGTAAFLFLWSLFTTLELMKLVLAVATTSTELHALDQERESGSKKQAN